MNTGNLKSYAPQARKDFIAAVTARANLLGLSEAKGQLVVAEAKASGDLVMIAGRPWPVKVNEQRNKLIARMQEQGFGHTVEAVAYAWFNRLAALRFMEVHDYLGHGRRVLSNPQRGLPEVLAHALDLAESDALPGLSADTVRELKLANQDPELYRLILIAQCNALHQAMPFLFEQLGDETELLLPENLLLTDSVVAKLVQSIPEEDWQQIEIIGWLYQFYISEKKDQVIGKVVKSEDIPAATQLFTPNWIVKYMVQNSLGAQWLGTYPDSPLKAQMEYYIEPAEQTDEVKAQLAAITPAALNPEELTLIDPACGSGHILVEAYDLFKAIYLERGYRQRDVAKLILEKNLYGLDIDERAAQLTGFALMMKGRMDDRQLFEQRVKLNVMALADSSGFDAERLAPGVKLDDFGLRSSDLTELKELFKHAKTFGSLIQVSEELTTKLPALKRLGDSTSQDMFVAETLTHLAQLVRQAEWLAKKYDAVVANPPYMGAKHYEKSLQRHVHTHYKTAQGDLYTCFMVRNAQFAKAAGVIGMITIPNWMFLSSFTELRRWLFSEATIDSLSHNGRGVFGSDFGSCAFVLRHSELPRYRGTFMRLFTNKGAVASNEDLAQRFQNADAFFASTGEFKEIPSAPVAYWIAPALLRTFRQNKLGLFAGGEGKNVTADNERFLRRWWEVSRLDLGRGKKWISYAKGGDFRRWAGNLDYVCDWSEQARSFYRSNHASRIIDEKYWYLPGVTWTVIATSGTAFRFLPPDTTFDTKGLALFFDGEEEIFRYLGLLNSVAAEKILETINPTMCINTIDVKSLPIPQSVPTDTSTVKNMVNIATRDWDDFETSLDFQASPLLKLSTDLSAAWNRLASLCEERASTMRQLETCNNRAFINAYGLQEELEPDVSEEKITLARADAEKDCQRLMSYAIGCMMGRYSLDAPGLIYAHSGNIRFDASRYIRFPADADGIVPITDELWFDDDAALRIREFLLAVWGAASLEANMAWLADNLGRKASESPEEAIRRYLADKFFKDHLQTYKKRPIYWLFSSGKQGAFQALVYLHRYNAGILSRLRAEYVIPLTGKMQNRIEQLERDSVAASTTAARNRSNKQLESLRKKLLELLAYDEQLRHYADQRIELDLDDGVKVNYGKFGDLLAEVKAVVGKKDEE